MLKSKLCHLHGMNREELIKHGEDPDDPGGYFIINGTEKVLIDVALQQTGGRRQDAARLLGWGRNTLTRKLKELEHQ